MVDIAYQSLFILSLFAMCRFICLCVSLTPTAGALNLGSVLDVLNFAEKKIDFFCLRNVDPCAS